MNLSVKTKRNTQNPPRLVELHYAGPERGQCVLEPSTATRTQEMILLRPRDRGEGISKIKHANQQATFEQAQVQRPIQNKRPANKFLQIAARIRGKTIRRHLTLEPHTRSTMASARRQL